MKILLSSVGRRPYLVSWFKEALRDNNLNGSVIAADLDEFSPSKSFADEFILSPRVDSKEYDSWLIQTIREKSIDLAVSINDFELSRWAGFIEQHPQLPLVTLTSKSQSIVEDKFLMSQILSEAGISSPKTWLASGVGGVKMPNLEFVTKGRYGSASRGLRFTSASNLEESILSALPEVTTPSGKLATMQSEIALRDLLIVQEKIEGEEFGLDIIADLDGKFVSVLARKKISMRSGETDRAVSVSAEPFFDLGKKITSVIRHRGSIDVDVIVSPSGEAYLIDVNPRLGGGYPFSHLAGAKVPSAYISWKLGIDPAEDWLRSEIGIIGGKHVEVVRIQ